MKQDAETVSITVALLAPTAIATVAAEYTYIWKFNSPWLLLAAYALSLVLALRFIWRSLKYSTGKKLLAIVGFGALSVFVSLYVCLIIAGANEDVFF